jgi:hypothetical protein
MIYTITWWQRTFKDVLDWQYIYPLFSLSFCSLSLSYSIRTGEPITVADRSKAWTVFGPSNARTVGSNPTQGMGVCIVCVYSVLVLLYVEVETLRRSDPPSRVSYRLCTRSRNWKSGQGPTKGCRVIKIIVRTGARRCNSVQDSTYDECFCSTRRCKSNGIW